MPVKSETQSAVDREIVTTRILNAPRELVYRAWTDPKHVEKWWGPNGFTSTIQEMDVRPGGVWRLVMHGPDGVDYKNKSIFVEVAAPERLVYEHVSGPKFLSTVTFEDMGGKTKVTMRMVFDTAEDLKRTIKEFGAVEGAKQTMSRLEKYSHSMMWIARTGEDAELFITRVFDAPRKLVFEAWSKPEHFQRWFAPAGLTMPGFTMDFRVGGTLSMTMRLPDGTDFPGDGVFDEIVPPEKISWTSYLKFQTPTMVVLTTVRFMDLEAKTQISVHQRYIKSANPEGTEQGWTSTLENLAALLVELSGR
jgi:uncharacterized protein YndB with AHSA1/START domain